MRKLLVCIDLKNENEASLKKYFERIKSELIEEVHFIHAYQTQVYADNFNVTTYPDHDEFEKFKGDIEGVLKSPCKDTLPKDLIKNSMTNVFLSPSPKVDIYKYAKMKDVDEIIIITRGLHGLEGIFHSSFADFMMKHSQCELTILRNNNH